MNFLLTSPAIPFRRMKSRKESGKNGEQAEDRAAAVAAVREGFQRVAPDLLGALRQGLITHPGLAGSP